MEGYTKPLPIRDERSAPFFDGLLDGELRLQHCLACDHWICLLYTSDAADE